MITRHPDTNFLMDYTTGGMALAPLISITTHLQFCDICRHQVEALESVGGELLDTVESIEVSDDLLEQVLDCLESDQSKPTAKQTRSNIDHLANELPGNIRDLLPEGELNWRPLSPSVRVAPVSVGETQNELALHRIKAGGKAPHHDHRGQEITVVLKGSFSDEDGVYQEGDFIVREPGDTHRPHAAQHEECICLSVLQAPIRLTGLKRLLNPFMKFSPS